MEINTGKIELSGHAFERLQERFPTVCKNKISATNHIRSLLKTSQYIGVVPDKDGCDSHMFVYNDDISIFLDIELTTVKTLFTIDRKAPVLALRSSIEGIYKKEFRKIHRLEMAKRRKFNDIVFSNELEIAPLRLRKHKTRSERVKIECDKRIQELKNEIWTKDNEIKNIQMTKRDIAYAIATKTF